MKNDERIMEIHKEIQQNILHMIPEKFKKVCLYASIIEGHKKTNGEMFFYYFPSGILKKNPINVYEIPELFIIDEEQYSKLEEKLYQSIQNLDGYYKSKDKKKWSNLTITISDNKYKVEFNYDNLIATKFNSMDRHIIWRYKYLDLPIESFNRKERKIIEKYFDSVEYYNANYVVYEENIYEKQKVLIMDYNKEENKSKSSFEEKDNEGASKKSPQDHISKDANKKSTKNQLLNY